MTYLRPQLLWWAAALVPLLGLCLWACAVAARRRRLLLGDQAAQLAPGFSRSRRLLRDGLALGAVGAVVFSLAGPVLGTVRREVEQRGVDVMVVLDTSRSMLAEDIEPSRLERAKRDLRGLVQRLHGHRLGVVTFAGDARVLVPLTHDGATLDLFLQDVDTSSNWTGGTAIGEGLELALEALEDNGGNEAVVILLTDGEDHTSDPPPQDVAIKALARGIPVHVVAVGHPDGAPIPLVSGRGGKTLLRDQDNQIVTTRPDEDLLEDIADAAGGVFLSAARTAFPLDELYDKRIALMEGVSRRSRLAERGIDRYQWTLVLALVLLGLRQVVGDRRTPS